MEWDAQLINIYLNVCQFFMQEVVKEKIRKTPNSKPHFTDEEVITIYIFGILCGYRNNKQIHQFIYAFLRQWFPYIPKYSTFNHRLNFISDEFVQFADQFIENFRSKIHHLNITGARVHDLTAVRNLFEEFKNSKVIGDKAYCDAQLKKDLNTKNVEIHTPYKLTKTKKELNEHEALYTKIINSFRQSVEIFFSWITDQTGIQNASKVRSTRGLGVHVFGRFAAAMILLDSRI